MHQQSVDQAVEIVRKRIKASKGKGVGMKSAKVFHFSFSFPGVEVQTYIPDYEMGLHNINTLPDRLIECLKENDVKGAIRI
jgi:hypothetical protein